METISNSAIHFFVSDDNFVFRSKRKGKRKEASRVDLDRFLGFEIANTARSIKKKKEERRTREEFIFKS